MKKQPTMEQVSNQLHQIQAQALESLLDETSVDREIDRLDRKADELQAFLLNHQQATA